MRRSLTAVLLCTLLAVPTGAALADGGDDVAALREEVQRLRDELDAVKRANTDTWLTEQRAEQIKALVADVLADADTRASFQNGMTAGHDGKFFLASPDGSYRLNIEGQIQVRWALNHARGAMDDTQWGFENRRTKLKFSGHVVDPTWTYTVQLASSRSGGPGGGGTMGLELAWIRKDLENGWTVMVGQFKAPGLREELVSSKRQLAVDRSLVNEAYNQDYSQGVELQWANDCLRTTLYYGDGFATRNTNFANTVANDGTELAVAARAEYLASGTWKQFNDFTSWSGDERGLMIGGAVTYERQTYDGVSPNGGAELFQWTVDLSLEMHPLNAFVAVVGRHGNDPRFTPTGTAVRQDSYAVMGQVGYHWVPDAWELFGRYEWGDTQGAGSTIPDLSIITAGVNHYVHKHHLKWTTDFGYAFGQVAGFYATSGAAWRTDTLDGQYVIRSQVQLLF